MLTDALREVRQHPGRIVATLIAIAIAVGFMAATSVFLATETAGLGKQLSRQYAQSDVLVSRVASEMPDADVIAAIKKTKGVRVTEAATSNVGQATANGTTLYMELYGLPSEDFRWASITDGAWPSSTDQIALPKDVAKKLGVAVGATVTIDQQKFTVSGLTDDPASRLTASGYLTQEAARAMSGAVPGQPEPLSGSFVIKITDDATAEGVVAALKPLTANEGFDVQSTQSFMDEQLTNLTQGIDSLKYVLMVFAVIALLVGMIIIANTFTILITQRRRQIGLLRAVGASTSQVRRKFLAEALIIGALGSLLGVAVGIGLAAIGSALTGSLQWGLSLPWAELGGEFLVGAVITLLAALLPVWRTSKIAPLEALRPVLNADSQKRVSMVRAVICTVVLAVGAALAVISLVSNFNEGSAAPVAYALGSATLITLAVLGAAPLYVSLMIRGWGKLIGFTGPTSRLATMNAARNPQRAAATSVALMLAIGLIVTLQVGTATVRQTVDEVLAEEYPVDVMVAVGQMEPTDTGELTPQIISTVNGMSNVQSKAIVKGGYTQVGPPIVAFDPAMSQVVPSLPASLTDDQVIISEQMLQNLQGTATSVSVPLADGTTVSLKPVMNAAGDNALIVTNATLSKFIQKPVDLQYWIKLSDRSDFATSLNSLEQLRSTHPTLIVGGSVVISYIINQVLNLILGITTALLGVAVAIALVGVANTLGLSVIERSRESALLRALGMTRSRLRLMLLIEAITLALVGVVVGVVAGTFFAWLGIRSVFRASGIERSASFAIDWTQTLGLIGIAVVASALASILPGRRAAMATPTEALAAD